MEWHGHSTQEIDRSEELRYDYRLHGVLLVASGRSCTAVLPACATASARDGPSRWTRVTCVAIRVAVVMPSTSGMVRYLPSTSGSALIVVRWPTSTAIRYLPSAS